jgi:hypothetical protein
MRTQRLPRGLSIQEALVLTFWTKPKPYQTTDEQNHAIVSSVVAADTKFRSVHLAVSVERAIGLLSVGPQPAIFCRLLTKQVIIM